VPSGVTNGVGDLSRELAYVHAHSSFAAVQLVLGTDPFSAGSLPVGGGLLSLP
jgi:hypothetical protein